MTEPSVFVLPFPVESAMIACVCEGLVTAGLSFFYRSSKIMAITSQEDANTF